MKIKTIIYSGIIFLFLSHLTGFFNSVCGQYQSYYPCLENYTKINNGIDSAIQEEIFMDEFEMLIQLGEQELAMDLTCMSAAIGVSIAEMTLGLLCLDGQSRLKIDKDEEQARYWFERAVKQGNTNSKYQLYRLYIDGRGGSKKINEGIWLLKSAAKDELPEAQYCLSIEFISGKFIPQNLLEAHYWAERSLYNGCINAKKLFAFIDYERSKKR